jgi:replicative DNA helicase
VEKLLPQNIEAECGVLGSIIIDPEAIVQVADFLYPEDFYRDAHRTIYEVILQLYEQREPADFITICDELTQQNKLEEVGGASYITSLVNQVPTSGNVEHYGRIVERTAILRRLIHAAGQIAAIAYEEGDADIALDKAEQLIFTIGQRHARSDFSTLRDLLSQYMGKLEQLHEHRGTIVGVPTGFADLDRLTGGLQKSDLIILAARPGIGKSSLSLSLAHNTAVKFQNSVAIFSLEMSKEQLVQRFLSMDASIDQQRLRTGWIEDDDWERIVYAMGTLSEANIWIDDTAGISTMEMRSKARRLQAEHGVDLVIVDYLQLMQATVGGKRNVNREQEISEISRSLKGLARELNIPVLALAQLSRAVETRSSKVPQLSDLRESGCLAAGTPVYLPDLGIYRPIEQLVGQNGFRILALNTETWRLEPCLVSRAFATGHKAVYRMTTRLGRTIRATANHQFLTIHGWQRLDMLSVGMHIAVSGSQISVGAGEGFTRGDFLQAGSLFRRGGSGVERGGGLYGRPRQGTVWPAIPQSDALSRAIGDEVISAYGRGGACPRPEKEHRNAWHSSSKGPARGSLTIGSGVISACSIVGAGDPAWGADNVPTLRACPHPESCWDEVIAIEPDGKADVYDLTVDELHNFIASDIICHNSIEQDSDIVMFIYRDDVYNPESERKNIADVIIAKHRNGPIGEISLYFQANQTRFRDLELNPPAE